MAFARMSLVSLSSSMNVLRPAQAAGHKTVTASPTHLLQSPQRLPGDFLCVFAAFRLAGSASLWGWAGAQVPMEGGPSEQCLGLLGGVRQGIALGRKVQKRVEIATGSIPLARKL